MKSETDMEGVDVEGLIAADVEACNKWRATLPMWVRHRVRREDNGDLFVTPLTPEQLAELRAWALRDPSWVEPPKEYTCDGCALAPTCSLVFDGWNTDGDCLYIK